MRYYKLTKNNFADALNVGRIYPENFREWGSKYFDIGCYVNHGYAHFFEEVSAGEYFVQFIKHALKEEAMEENDKEIIGWKLKEDCKKYEQAALNIVNQSKFYNFAEGYNFSTNSENESTFKKAGVLELWFNPVYKEKTLQFGGYDVTFEKVTSGVRITCNGETGTFSQIEAIYNKFKADTKEYKFGSRVVGRVDYDDNSNEWVPETETDPDSIKIGCTTGIWKEFTAIY